MKSDGYPKRPVTAPVVGAAVAGDVVTADGVDVIVEVLVALAAATGVGDGVSCILLAQDIASAAVSSTAQNRNVTWTSCPAER